MTIDEKDLYWSEELNKHDHKKFEVEVINTVKLRLMDRMGSKFWDLKPTFQAYVKKDNGKALIDLTFDAINVGLEVDEGHHARQKEADKQRELNILEKMAMIGRDDFEICRVDVTHGVEKKMEDIEKFLQCVRKHVTQHKKFNWDDRPGFVRYKSGDKIKFKDNFEFITKSDLFNTLLQTPNWGKASKGKNSYVEELYKKYGYNLTKGSYQTGEPRKELEKKYPNQLFMTRDLNNWTAKGHGRFCYNEYSSDLKKLDLYSNEDCYDYWHDEATDNKIYNYFIGKGNKIKFVGRYKMTGVEKISKSFDYKGTPVKMKYVLHYEQLNGKDGTELQVA